MSSERFPACERLAAATPSRGFREDDAHHKCDDHRTALSLVFPHSSLLRVAVRRYHSTPALSTAAASSASVLFEIGSPDASLWMRAHSSQSKLPLQQAGIVAGPERREGPFLPTLPVSSRRLEGRWVRVALRKRGPAIEYFYGGRRVGHATLEPGERLKYRPAPSVLGGCLDLAGGDHFEGDIAEFRVSEIARQVEGITAATRLTSDPFTVLRYDFADAIGGRVPDLSGNGLDGAVGTAAIDLVSAAAP